MFKVNNGNTRRRSGVFTECQPKNNDCYYFQDNWEFMIDRATVAQ